MSSSMRNFMEAYSAVHNTEAKEALTSGRDEITEMNLSSLTQSDLDEIVESVLEEMFQKGYSVDSAHTIFSEMFVESNIKGRQDKIERLCESLNKAFEVIDSKASTVAMEEFVTYRNNKRLQESWSARFNQEKRIERTHNQLVAQESLNVKTLLLKLVEKADKSYLETDMKKRQANNEKARKDMEKMGTSMKNPHFEEVSQIRKSWGDAYASIYEKKLDPVGKEDGDVDNDGDKDSSDEYLMKRRKAIGKAMGKKDMKETYTVTAADKKGNTKAYQNYKAGMKKKDGSPMYKAADHMKEGVRDMDPEKGTAERKARLEKKRGMKMDDHPQFKKEETEVEEGIDFKGAKRIDDAREAKRKALYKKSPSTKDKDLMKGKFRPAASDEERKSGYRDIMREKGTQPKKDGKPMFTKEEMDRIEAIVNNWED